MPVIRYADLQRKDVDMEGVKDATRVEVIGGPEGWQENVMRVFRLGPGGYTPRHQHDWEHVNHVISGRGKLRIGDTVHDLGEKDFALVPPNTEHQFENPFDEPFEFICIVPNRGNY